MGYKLLLSEDDIPLQVSIDYESPYFGIVFNYRTVSIKETMFGNCKIKFDYDIIEGLDLVEKMSQKEKQEFERYLGDILLEIVTGIHESRDDNPEEPDTQ